MKYFSSDFHDWHKNIIRYCNRPFGSVDDMHNTLVNNWNAIVKPEDEMYFLGDLGMSLSEKTIDDIFASLNCIKKVMCLGNHDLKNAKKFKHIFETVYDFGVTAEVEIMGNKYKMNHMPYVDAITKYDGRFAAESPKRTWGGERLLCGHVHNNVDWIFKDNMLNVGVDNWDFKPVSEIQIHEIFEKNEPILRVKEEYK